MGGRKRVGRKEGSEAWVLDDAGHRTVLTPQLVQDLLSHAERGYWPAMCALLCRVAPETLQRWLERGVEEDAIEPYRSFAEAFVMAELEVCAELEDKLRDIALGKVGPLERGEAGPDAGVIQWLLVNRYSQLWRGGGVSATQIVLTGTSSKTLRAKAEAFLKSLPQEHQQRARAEGLSLPA